SPSNAIVANIDQDGRAEFGQQASSGTSGIISAASGWSVNPATKAIKKAGWIILTAVLNRTGGTMTASSEGNFADTGLCTIQAAWRPDSFLGNDRMVTAWGTGFTSGSVGLNPSTGLVDLLDG